MKLITEIISIDTNENNLWDSKIIYSCNIVQMYGEKITLRQEKEICLEL